MPAQTIDEVISSLDEIIADSRREGLRFGYFAALYHRVTVAVKEGIASGRFEDGVRMEKLDVIFANRYIEAYRQFRRGETPSQCWRVAFDTAALWRPLILQHLLLGMNAHINLDLGISAAQTSPGDDLPALKRDFDEINVILSELLDEVQDKLKNVSPWFGLLDRWGGRHDEGVMNFSLKLARISAWRAAENFARNDGSHLPAMIADLDAQIAELARRICHPGFYLTLLTFVIRIAEESEVKKVIDALA